MRRIWLARALLLLSFVLPDASALAQPPPDYKHGFVSSPAGEIAMGCSWEYPESH